MKIDINKIHCCNCLDGIRQIGGGSIQAIICDPPYFLGMTHDGHSAQMADLSICLPFYRELFKEFKRVLTPDGCLYWFCDWRSYAFYFQLFDEIKPRNLIVWDKRSGCGSFYTNEHELIVFATNNNSLRLKSARNIIREIPSFSSGAKKTNGEKVHPTQKPVELIEKIILDSTKPGDTVLDCFMGSGTTAVAARRTGRNFYGFEQQHKYAEIGNKRLENE